MRGVYLVAAELARHGYMSAPISRNAFGADLLVTDSSCNNSFSVQVKTNATTFSFWLINRKAKELRSHSHVYVLVNLLKNGEIEYFIVPSEVVADNLEIQESSKSTWISFSRSRALEYKDKWNIFEQLSD